MLGKALSAVVAAAIVVVVSFTAWETYTNGKRLEAIERTVISIDSGAAAREAAVALIRSQPRPASERFCSGREEGHPLCATVTQKIFKDLGKHDDLWVFYDAAIHVWRKGGNNLDQRRALQRLQADLVAHAATNGIWAMLQESGEYRLMLTASDLRWATLAQAASCEAVPASCAGQLLPPALARTMGILAGYLLSEGRQVAPYEIKRAASAISAIIESGLVPAVLPPVDDEEAPVVAEAFD